MFLLNFETEKPKILLNIIEKKLNCKYLRSTGTIVNTKIQIRVPTYFLNKIVS